MILIGMDIATVTGVALRDDDGQIKAWSFRVDGDGPGDVFKAFEDKVYRILKKHRPVRIAIEAPLRSDISRETTEEYFVDNVRHVRKVRSPITNINTLRKLYGFTAIVYACACRCSIPVEEVKENQWRSAFGVKIGKGVPSSGRRKAWKQAAIDRCRLVGVRALDSDAAEAVGVLWWLQGQMVGPRGARVRAESLFSFEGSDGRRKDQASGDDRRLPGKGRAPARRSGGASEDGGDQGALDLCDAPGGGLRRHRQGAAHD
ncbi:RuvC family protein [Rhodobium gokarnense]|uniref:Uncharacterized protein n=1 Tax=Rhodobium gokarnense TaxID=364296 RepID=A0ABT3HH21_9HYPH|nr:hypothetical protein [Rhodobium gokarnense]MCW2309697.1 hypothetical protein [Rhodobium gokarnense]